MNIYTYLMLNVDIINTDKLNLSNSFNNKSKMFLFVNLSSYGKVSLPFFPLLTSLYARESIVI